MSCFLVGVILGNIGALIFVAGTKLWNFPMFLFGNIGYFKALFFYKGVTFGNFGMLFFATGVKFSNMQCRLL